MEVDLVGEALKFMFLGMGVVFGFLIIMIFVLKIQTSIITKYFPQKEEKPKTWQPDTTKVDNTAKKIAAITAVIQHHKNMKG